MTDSVYLYRLCRLGQAPAEALTARDRDCLVRMFWKRGWTVTEIARHTRMSTYTTARILERLDLEVFV